MYAGKVVTGTVRGDTDDIGKDLVAVMLVRAGFEVLVYGVDIGPDASDEAAREPGPQLLGTPILLTTTILGMGATIKALLAAQPRGDLSTPTGGAPVTIRVAQTNGAYGYADHAAEVIDMALTSLGGKG